MESVEESGLIQNISFKTFQDGDGNLTNTLDLLFTDSINRVDSVEDSPPLGGNISKAHLVLSWKYNLKSQTGYIPKYKKTKYLYIKADHVRISDFLNGID